MTFPKRVAVLISSLFLTTSLATLFVSAEDPSTNAEEVDVAGRICGVDELPVENALIRFVDIMSGTRTQTRTDKEGRYTARIHRSQDQVEIRWPGRENSPVPEVRDSGIAWEGATSTYDFPCHDRGAIRIAMMTGTGAFVPDARILVGPLSEGGSSGGRSVTLMLDDKFASAAEGVYVAPSLVPGTYVVAVLEAGGEVFDRSGNGAWAVEVPSEGKKLGRLKLVGQPRNRQLVVRASSPTAADLQNAPFMAARPTDFVSALILGKAFDSFCSDSEGKAVRNALAPARYYVMSPFWTGDSVGTRIRDLGAMEGHVFPLALMQGSAVDLRDSKELECAFPITKVLPESLATLKVRVVDSVTNKAAERASVVLWEGPGEYVLCEALRSAEAGQENRLAGLALLERKTNSEGSCEISRLPPGEYAFVVHRSGESLGGQVFHATIPAGQTREWQIALEPRKTTGKLIGSMDWPGAGDREIPPCQQVLAIGDSGFIGLSSPVDVRGNFEILSLPVGRYRLIPIGCIPLLRLDFAEKQDVVVVEDKPTSLHLTIK